MGVLLCTDQAGTRREISPGQVACGFREQGSYRFRATVAGASLFIDDAPAEVEPTDGAGGWRWQPGFFAGRVAAELVGEGGERLGEYWFDVAPDDQKLGGDVFRDMLDQLYAFDPGLVLGSEAAQADIGVSGNAASTLLSYARLRRHGEALVDALRAVAARPLTQLVRERALVPWQRVRKLDAASARRLARRPETLAILRGQVDPLLGSSRLEIESSSESLDCPANQAMTAILLSVRRRCVQVADELTKMAANDEPGSARSSLTPKLARRLEFLSGLSKTLATVSRRSPYACVADPKVTAAGLNAISAHPDYARAYRFAWCVLRPGVAGDVREESVWLSPTWEIYERWCFTRVADRLQKKFGKFGWTTHHPSSRSDCIRLVGKLGSTRIEAWLQRRFSSPGESARVFTSASLPLRPDIVVVVRAGRQRRMMVLDAKYRTTRPNVLDAMRSAHVYQDALRWEGRRADCTLLLVPAGGGAMWLEDPAFHRSNSVGVHVLSPESQSLSGLDVLFDEWIASCLPAQH